MANQVRPTAQTPSVNNLWVMLGLLASIIGAGIGYFALGKSLDIKNAFTEGIDCNVNAWVNCDTAFSSSFANFLGIPVGAWGLFFYIFAAIAFLIIKNSKNTETRSNWGSLVVYLSAFAIAFSLLKAYQLVLLQTACPICISMYAVNIAIFVFAWLSGFRFNVPSVLTKWALPLGLAAAIFGFGYLYTKSSMKKMVENPVEITAGDTLLQKIKAFNDYDKTEALTIPFNANTPVKGGKDAKTVVHIFSDFQCPGCKRGAEIMASLSKEFGDKIRIYEYNFPLDMSINRIIKQPFHPFAGDAAKLSVCAQKQGKFGAYHDQTFARQADITADVLKEIATNVGVQNVEACLTDTSVIDAVKADIETGIQLGIQGTPAIFINGKLSPVTGNYDVMKAIIQREIDRDSKK